MIDRVSLDELLIFNRTNRLKMDTSRAEHGGLLTELLGKYLSLVGIAPCYSFKTNQFVYSKVYRCYLIFLAIGIIVLYVSSTFTRFIVIYPGIFRTFVLNNVVLEISGLSISVVTILSSSLWNMSTWGKLFQILQRTNTRIILNRTKTNKFFRNFSFFFVLGNAYLVSLFILDLGHYPQKDKTPRYFVSTIIFRYLRFTISLTIFYVVNIMKCAYEETNWIMKWNINVKQQSAFTTMDTVKTLYLDMSHFSQIFNELFGWPILLICFFSVAQLLDCLSYTSPLALNGNGFKDIWQLFVHMLYAFEIGVSNFFYSYVLINIIDAIFYGE